MRRNNHTVSLDDTLHQALSKLDDAVTRIIDLPDEHKDSNQRELILFELARAKTDLLSIINRCYDHVNQADVLLKLIYSVVGES